MSIIADADDLNCRVTWAIARAEVCTREAVLAWEAVERAERAIAESVDPGISPAGARG